MTDTTETVVVRKVLSRGERLQLVVEDTGDEIKLDALALESLTWQDPDYVAEIADQDPPVDTTSEGGLEFKSDDGELRIVNEYSQILITSSEAAPGNLRIVEPSEGFEIELDEAHLSQLATVGNLDFVTELLRYSPFGPTPEAELSTATEE